jgi:hypothetical protein
MKGVRETMEKFEMPKVQVINLEAEDIITESEQCRDIR